MSAGWTEADLLHLKSLSAPYVDPRKLIKAKGRICSPMGMNKGETAYQAHLELEKRIGEVLYFEYEPISLKLAHDVRYTPDFLVVKAHLDIEFHEVKGKKTFKRPDGSVIRVGAFMEEDARLKIAMAAAKFPYLRFLMVWPGSNGRWDSKEY